jgi:hypothetical protein
MEIAGEWVRCSDGVVRPMVRVGCAGTDCVVLTQYFLIDSGADRTVLSADYLRDLGLTSEAVLDGSALAGVSGSTPFVQVAAGLELTTTSGSTATIRGQFAAFTDPAATDYSILGRDVLDSFDLIIARQRGPIRLLAPRHSYQIVPA